MATSLIGVSNPQKKPDEGSALLNTTFIGKLQVALTLQPKVRRTVSSFEELCPRWSEILSRKITPIERGAIHVADSCIVGEAWGFGPHYFCLSCISFGHKFTEALCPRCGAKENNDGQLAKLKADFLKHWNKRHGSPSSQ
jgi:hypothetical protein